MEPSILNSVKKNLGVEQDYDVFDGEIVTYINTAFSTLSQLGVGPATGFVVEDEAQVWSEFLNPTTEKVLLSSVKTYVYLRVRLIFDPPSTSYALKSFEDQLQELEWRMNAIRESTDWVDPTPVVVNDA